MTTRRTMLGILASTPVVGPAIGQAVNRHLGNSGFGLDTPAGALLGDASSTSEPTNRVNEPLVPRWKAHKLLLEDKQMRDLLTSHFAVHHRHIGTIDPDIDVHRSFSLAAKIVYQRQRNVERALKSFIEDERSENPNNSWTIIRQYVSKLMWGT